MGHYEFHARAWDKEVIRQVLIQFTGAKIESCEDERVTILIPDGQPDRPKMPWLTVSNSIDRTCNLLLHMTDDDPPDEDDASYLRDQIVQMLDGQVDGCDQPLMLRSMIQGRVDHERRIRAQWENNTAEAQRTIRNKIASIVDDIRSGRK